jgi:hypothetical protein
MIRATPFLLAALVALSSATFIDNMVPRLSNKGEIMDSHDFSLRKYPCVEGYIMCSIAYGECKEPPRQGCDQTPDHCGFQLYHTINIWQSNDLSSGSWSHITTAVSLDNRPPGTIYRPDAIWNPHTQNVVLWYNWLNLQGVYEGYAAYTAPTPAGPFTRVRERVNVTIQNSTENCGDFHLFLDPADGTPYVIAGCGFHMWIERLLPNMLDSAGDTSPTGRYLFSEYFIEAPALFFREGTYYAVFGSCCCYCFQGSGAIVHTAPHPLGPWTLQGDIACVPSPNEEYRQALGLSATPTPGQGCQHVDPTTTSAMRSQQSFIAAVDTPTGPEFIWVRFCFAVCPAALSCAQPPHLSRSSASLLLHPALRGITGWRPLAAELGRPQGPRPPGVGAPGLQR